MPSNKISLRKSLAIASGIVKKSIVSYLTSGVYPKDIPDSVSAEPVHENEGIASVEIVSDSRLSLLGPTLTRVYELGSGIWGKKGEKYPIVPKDPGGKLAFDWPEAANIGAREGVREIVTPVTMTQSGFEGGRAILPGVMHPGVQAKPFIKNSWDNVKDEVLSMIADNVVVQILPEYKK